MDLPVNWVWKVMQGIKFSFLLFFYNRVVPFYKISDLGKKVGLRKKCRVWLFACYSLDTSGMPWGRGWRGIYKQAKEVHGEALAGTASAFSQEVRWICLTRQEKRDHTEESLGELWRRLRISSERKKKKEVWRYDMYAEKGSIIKNERSCLIL